MSKELVPEKDMNIFQKLNVIQSRLVTLGINEVAGKKGADGKADKSSNFSYNYVSFGKIKKALMPLMLELDLAIYQPIRVAVEEGKHVQYLDTFIYNTKTGKKELESTCLISNTIPNDNNGYQKIGSGITYMRRYSLTTILGLVTDKDDDCYTSEEDYKEMVQQAETVAELNGIFSKLEAKQQASLKSVFSARRAEIEKAVLDATKITGGQTGEKNGSDETTDDNKS